MSDLVVRAYNVGFGDAVLVSIPERSASGRETTRHILFDVGNLLTGAKNADEVFEGVVRDIIDRTGGEVDLYVMTHEHLDHVQGLLSAARKGADAHREVRMADRLGRSALLREQSAGAQASDWRWMPRSATRSACCRRRRTPSSNGCCGTIPQGWGPMRWASARRTTSTTCARSHRRTARTTSTAR